MIGGWAATIEVRVSVAFAMDQGEQAVQELVSQRNAGDWFIRGPRGGRHIAPAGQETVWTVDQSGFFERNEWRFLGHRKELRYVRPGSRLAARFDADSPPG